MINAVKKTGYRHVYLFIAAAWLYTISFLFTNYFSPSSSPEKAAAAIGNYISSEEKEFEKLVTDTAFIRSISSSSHWAQVKNTGNEKGLFVYVLNDKGNPIQIQWNTNAMGVSDDDLQRKDGYYSVEYQNGIFELLKKSIRIQNRDYIIAELLPLYWSYFVSNDYLEPRFAKFSELNKKYSISVNVPGTPVLNSQQQEKFYIQKIPGASTDQPGVISIILRLLSIILLMIFINATAYDLAKTNGFFAGFTFLTVFAVLLRGISYLLPFPFDYQKLELFDTLNYASSMFNSSLGDLFINAIFVFWITSFIKFNIHGLLNDEKKLSNKFKRILAIVSLLLLPVLTNITSSTISSLINDSQISLDVTNFQSLTRYSAISVVIICFIALSFFYVFQLLVNFSMDIPLSNFWKLTIICSAALTLLSFNLAADGSAFLNFMLILWMLITYLIAAHRNKDVTVSLYNSGMFILWSIYLMSSVAVLLIYQNVYTEQERRKKIAEKYSLINDPASEFLLSMAVTNLTGNSLEENFERFRHSSSNKYLKDSLINANFHDYFNKFNTRIYTFDSSFKPLFNEDAATQFSTIESIIASQSEATDIEDLYYYEKSQDDYTYIYKKQVPKDSTGINGFLFLIIKPKVYKNSSEQLVAELFKTVKNEPLEDIYAFAIYKNGKLNSNSGNYSFADFVSTQKIPKYENVFRENNGYNELWYNSGDNKIVVIAKKDNWLILSITSFAYLFCTFIALVALMHFCQLVINTRFKTEGLRNILRFSLRTQMQATFIFISIISFIIIGIVTLIFFNDRFTSSTSQKLTGTAGTIVSEIQQLRKNFYIKDEMFNINYPQFSGDLEKQIIDLAETHKIDINLYSPDGELKVSTWPYVFTKQVLTEKMNPSAYVDMRVNHFIQSFQKEKIGNLNYNSIYVPLKDDDGSLLAYLSIPYLKTQKELDMEISNFLIILIDLIAIIFIFTSSVAVFITRRITESFILIGNKMKEISFSAGNEEIEWHRNDEIGELVNEYNKMVRKLDASARALARSEREGAWREMARQVAHEIKNPLTPMKLSIQYLQKAIDNNSSNVKELSQQVANTLVEQIDQLAKIAGDFSQFANIANVRNENFDVSEVIKSVTSLFRADNRLYIHWKKEENDYNIVADKIQINRLFTNLVKNAVEAQLEKDVIEVYIHQYTQNGNIVVQVEDKGSGIAKELQPKIFTPNFTTKTSGTGLGLAICRGIAEKANGQIWFTTKENEGTSFYVSFPKAGEQHNHV